MTDTTSCDICGGTRPECQHTGQQLERFWQIIDAAHALGMSSSDYLNSLGTTMDKVLAENNTGSCYPPEFRDELCDRLETLANL